MYRVTTVLSGPLVVGGGISRFYFAETAGTAAQAHAAVVSFWNAVDEVMSTQVSFTVEGEIEEWDAATGTITGVDNTDPYTATGTATGDPLPPATQGLIRWRTGFYTSGRELRGRTFIPGMTEGNNGSDGKPASGVRVVLGNAANSLRSGASHQLSVYSRTHATAAPVTSSSVWTEWAQLRSRRD